MDAPLNDLVRALRATPEIRAEGDATPVMAGHFAVFDEWTKIDSAYEGRFMERIAPGAFTKTLKENRSAIKVLFNHGNDPTMGDMVLGIPDVLEEDDYGARYEVPLFDGVPPLVVSGLRAGAYGASFRFRVIPGKEQWVDTPERSAQNPDAIPERTITEAQVFEFGAVTFPAYANATAGVRSVSMTDEFLRRRGIPIPGTPDVGAAVLEAPEPLRHSGRTPAEREAILRSFNL